MSQRKKVGQNFGPKIICVKIENKINLMSVEHEQLNMVQYFTSKNKTILNYFCIIIYIIEKFNLEMTIPTFI